MKNLIKFILIFLFLLPLISVSQNNDKTDKEFQTFWKDFKGAILNSDNNKVLNMTHFPFTSDGEVIQKEGFKLEKYFYDFLKSEIKKIKKIKRLTESFICIGSGIEIKKKMTVYYFEVDNESTDHFYFAKFDDKIKWFSYELEGGGE